MKKCKFAVLCIIAVALLFACEQPNSVTPGNPSNTPDNQGLAGTIWEYTETDTKNGVTYTTTDTLLFGESTFALTGGGKTDTGSWNLEGTVLTLTVGNYPIVMAYDNGVITYDDGKDETTFTKKGSLTGQNQNLAGTTWLWTDSMTVDGVTHTMSYKLTFGDTTVQIDEERDGDWNPNPYTYPWSLVGTELKINGSTAGAYINGVLVSTGGIYTKQ